MRSGDEEPRRGTEMTSGDVKIGTLEKLRVRHPGGERKGEKKHIPRGARDDIRVARIGLGVRRSRLAFRGNPIAGSR